MHSKFQIISEVIMRLQQSGLDKSDKSSKGCHFVQISPDRVSLLSYGGGMCPDSGTLAENVEEKVKGNHSIEASYQLYEL